MVTDISAADLRSWSGAGPLPRARSISSGSGSAAKMTHVVESAVRVEPWEVGYATVAVHRTGLTVVQILSTSSVLQQQIARSCGMHIVRLASSAGVFRVGAAGPCSVS